MVLRTSVEVEAGAPVVRHVADAADAERLRRRAAGLTAAAGPGVVAVVRSGATVDDGWELVTTHAGLSLDARRVDGPVALAAIGAAVAETLARLHAAGVVHGRLEVEHIAVGADGTPVLWGFESSDHAPSHDVEALGRILVEVASPLAACERLATVVACACDADPERRPTARRLAADLAAIARPAQRSRVVPKGAAVAAAGLLVVLAVGVLRGRGSASGSGVISTTVVTTARSTTSSASPGGAVEVDGRRIVIGRPTDEVLMGDWGCEGERPAVLRPTTGEVLVYDVVVPGAAPEVVQAERIDGATGLAAGTDRDGCATLLVLTDVGSIRLT